MPSPRLEDLSRGLQKCIFQRDSAEALRLHACLQEHGLDDHPSLGNALVIVLAQSGNVSVAQQAFDRLASPDASAFNSLINAYAKQGESHHALDIYQKMQNCTPLHPSIHTYVALLKSCARLRDLDRGRGIHTDIIREREVYGTNVFIGSAVIDMYAKCGCPFKAQDVFDTLPEKNTVAWTALISGYTDNGHPEEALHCFDRMQLQGVLLDAVMYICILKACASVCDIQKGQIIHADIVRKGLERDSVVASSLVVMHAKCGLLATARDMFEKFHDRDVVLWNTLIVGYAEEGLGEEALEFYKRMQSEGICPDIVIFVCIVKACGSVGATHEGQEIHADITKKALENDPYIANTLIDLYVKCSLLAEAQQVLSRSPYQTVVSWNALLTGYVDHGHGKDALACFMQMQGEDVAPDSVTFICTLKACGTIGAIIKGCEIHSEIVKKGLYMDVAIGSTLVDMYSKCGSLVNAREAFDKLTVQDIVSWNALIAGYVDHGHGYETLDCIEIMQRECIPMQQVTYVCGLKAAGSIRELTKGLELHTETVKKGLETGMRIGSSLVDMYIKCSSLTNAQEVFQGLHDKDVVLWNTLLVGFVDHECCVEALEHFEQMQHEGVCPDDVSFICSLKACETLGMLNEAYEIHAELTRKGWEGDIFIGNTLVDTYVNGGTLAEAQNVFDKLSNRTAVSWNALIVGYAEQGYGGHALQCFEQMQCDGVLCDNVTLVCTLKACATTGSMDMGRRIHSKVMRMGFDADMLIANTLVDMYCKCGAPKDADYTFNKLLSRTVASWNALMVGSMESGRGEDPLAFFEKMQHDGVSPDETTFVCCLRACGNEGAVIKGRELHMKIYCEGLESGEFMGNALLDMYAKCGLLEEAENVLDKVLPARTLYSLNAINAGYCQLGESGNVFWTFHRMVCEGIAPNAITFVSVLNSCNHSGIVDRGHMYFEAMSRDFGIIPTLQHLTCVIDLLGRAGQIEKVVAVIAEMPFHPGLVVWHTVLGASRKWCDVDVGKQAFEHAVQLNETNSAAYISMSNIYAGIDMQEFELLNDEHESLSTVRPTTLCYT